MWRFRSRSHSIVPLDTSCQAEYEDGFVLDETEHDDVAQYGDGNIFRDILKKRPNVDHGRMVRFSVFWKNHRYDVDWTTLPDDAEPVRLRHGYTSITIGGEGESVKSGWTGVDFGYQADEQGEVVELR